MDSLTRLVKQKRNIEKRVTNENKSKIINQMNKASKDYGFQKISKDASVREIERFKKEYSERLTYDIVTLAVSQGKDIIAEIESRDLKKSADTQYKRLGEFGKDLAKAKHESDKHLSTEQKEFIARGNVNIKGYGQGENGIVNLFENAKTPKEIKALINEIKNQDVNKIYYDKQISTIERTFQKVGIVREDDLNKLKERFSKLNMNDLNNQVNEILRKIDVFDYEKFSKESVDETEIANARLDDILIKNGLKKTGSKKVQKVFDKYKTKE